jgi:hypothetical protein
MCLALSGTQLQAVGAWNLGTSFTRAQRWVQSVAPEVAAPVTRAVKVIAELGNAVAEAISGEAWVLTDDWNYIPGEIATITGGGFQANETVWLQVKHITGATEDGKGHDPWPVTADEHGAFESGWYVDPDDSLGSQFLLTADGAASGLHAEYEFQDANAAADIDQCQNGQAPSPPSDGCDVNATDWANGNVGPSKAVYVEGDTIPYRIKFDNLTLASHAVTIEWDTTKSGKHAIDYLKTFSATVLSANPCLGVSGCIGPASTYPIPKDPQVDNGAGSPIAQAAGNFTLYGGTITSVSAYAYPDGAGFAGDKSARITITFTASVINPVLAWGGHIATRQNWGAGNSAVAISGSPYHTRLIDLDGSGGNQDLSLSADAIIFPGSITVVKQASVEGSTSFGFTASPAPLGNFSLVDDGTSANTFAFNNIMTFVDYTITESSIPAGWGFDSVSCSATSPNGGSYTTGTASTTIAMKEGENWTCTFNNSVRTGTLIVKKHVVNDNGGSAVAGDWDIHVKSGGVDVANSPKAGSESGEGYGLTNGTYNVSESGGPSGYTQTGFSGDCDASGNVTVVSGQIKTCTITNDDDAASLVIIKNVVNDNGGSKAASAFSGTISGVTASGGNSWTGTAAPGVTKTLTTVGAYSVTETADADYDTSYSTDCTGTIALGETKTCTVTNNDKGASLIIIKNVVNDNGGSKSAGDFGGTISGVTASGGNSWTGTATPGVTKALTTIGAYSVTETLDADYDTTYSADCTGTIALGQTKTCTVTNNDKAASLIIIKNVVNDHGGSKAAAAFSGTISGVTASGGNSWTGTAAPGVTKTLTSVGAYDVTETPDADYDTSYSADCTGTIALGQTKTCTVTNNDKAASLIIIKNVVNDNGGSKAASAFSGTISGVTASGGNSWTGTAAPGVTKTLTTVGGYSVTETLDADYDTSYSADCTGTIALGQTKTCTVTNNDKGASLVIIKNVVNDNGGSKSAGDFGGTISGVTASGGNSWTGTAAPGVTKGLTTVGGYSVTETSDADYDTTYSADCTGTIALGQTKTCTVTNNDKAASLIIIKNVVNDNGGSKSASAFSGAISGVTTTTGSSWTGTASPGVTKILTSVGAYEVTETPDAQYTTSYSADCTGTIALGQTKTCTVTNNDKAAQLKVIKACTPSDDPGLFNLRIDGSVKKANAACGTDTGFVEVNAGAHTVSETAGTNTVLGDYIATINGNCAANGSVTLALGEQKTCTITNVRAGHARVTKTVSFDNHVTPGPLSSFDSFTFQIRYGATTQAAGTILETKTVTSANGGVINFTLALDPTKTYQLCEIVMVGWNSTLTDIPGWFTPYSPPPADNSAVCVNFTVSAGETKNFNVDNSRPPGGLSRTIGYWKNWSSCTGGKQKPILDQQLPITLGNLTLTTCLPAVRILDKRDINNVKYASDPAYNMAAQLLAAIMNYKAGALFCTAAQTAVDSGLALLSTIKFDGVGLEPMTALQKTTANTLATLLDKYNNNNIAFCGAPQTVPVAPAITSADNATFAFGVGGTFTLTATGTAPLTKSATGLPAGVTFNATTGVLTVSTTVPVGTYPITFKVSNFATVTQAFTLTVQ